ncbi:lysophospholipid acyltransferase family protein [Mycoplasmopsis cricetuli]|uniref:lysophospholipid acyltransferase family protein n=1 Tax=Mycoplasmopsis cricetuli TaxID=171283 RepID=UPI00055C4C19|nr:lysophospholipid acyltransferase family protein [Mycoplasmopsis cricetuli]
MIKITISPIFKKIFFWFPWLFRVKKIMSMYRKYKKDPESLGAQFRNDYFVKLSKKILNIYNIDLEIIGFDNIPKNGPLVLTPNHKSNIDAVALIAALEKQSFEQGTKNRIVNFLAKEELNKKFLLKRIMFLKDTITLDRSNFRDSLLKLKEFGEFIKQNGNIGVIFPEGTRIKEEKLGEFKSGPFKVAANLYLPIVPVAIINSSRAFEKKRPKRLKITISFLKPIKPINFLSQDSKAIANRIKNLIQEEIDKYNVN